MVKSLKMMTVLLTMAAMLSGKALADATQQVAPYKPGYVATLPNGDRLKYRDKSHPDKGYVVPKSDSGKVISYEKKENGVHAWYDQILETVSSIFSKAATFVKKHKIAVSVSMAGAGMAVLGLWWLQGKLRNKYQVYVVVPSGLTFAMKEIVGSKLLGEVGEAVMVDTFPKEEDAVDLLDRLQIAGFSAWIESNEGRNQSKAV